MESFIFGITHGKLKSIPILIRKSLTIKKNKLEHHCRGNLTSRKSQNKTSIIAKLVVNPSIPPTITSRGVWAFS
jgi:hypothetical protein